MTERVGAVVLAGGRSARFGRDKLAQPLDGRPLLHHAIEAVRAVTGLDEIIVVAAPGAVLDLPADVRLVHDQDAFQGPLAGVATGLGAVSADIDRVIVVGGDMPTLRPAVLDALLARLHAMPEYDLALLEDDQTDQGLARPLPAAIRRRAGLAMASTLLADDERRLLALQGHLRTDVMDSEAWGVLDPDGATLRDVDVPEDLPPGR